MMTDSIPQANSNVPDELAGPAGDQPRAPTTGATIREVADGVTGVVGKAIDSGGERCRSGPKRPGNP